MKILYLCGDQGIPVFGRKGASTHIREMIRAFRNLGHEVVLAASDLSGDRRADESFPCVELPRYKSKLLGIDGRYITGNFLARRVLKKVVREHQPDAIYERSALYFTAGEAVSHEFSLPRILEINALLSKEQRERLHFPNWAFRQDIGLARRAKAVASISDVMKEELVSLGCEAEKIRSFPMAVDPERFSVPEDPFEKRDLVGWGRDEIVFGYLGSMNAYHRPDWFMDLAEKYLQQEDCPYRFLIVGGSPTKVDKHRSRLKPWVDEGKVHFTGTVPQEDMPHWIASMSVVLVPGAAPQSTPTKIFEAASVGTPMILPATKPICKIFSKVRENLFEENSFSAFEEKVSEFLNSPQKYDELTIMVKDLVTEGYTWESHGKKLSAWLSSMR